MKSSTLIVSYLWKDTWKRWCEQPGSPAARIFVAGLLVLVAAVILFSLQLFEKNLRKRLEHFGLNTLVMRQTVTADSAEFTRTGDGADRLAALGREGRKLRLRQLFARAQTEFTGANLFVLTYSDAAVPALAQVLSADEAICLSDTLPAGTLLRARVGRRTVMARVRQPPDWLRPAIATESLLVRQGTLSDEEELGYVDTTVFHRAEEGAPMERIIMAVNDLFVMEHREPPQIQSALPLVRELDRLHQLQQQWHGLLAAILGAAIALIYGVIAVLEFRQNMYVGALLRSFGASARFLYFRHWLENAVLANLAALGGIMLATLLGKYVFATLSYQPGLKIDSGVGFSMGITGAILLWVNLGAFLSSLPIMAGLRKPVGKILN